MTNNWNAIRRHYELAKPKIMAEKKTEWGIDPYAWEGAGIVLTPIESWLWHDIRAVDAVLYPQFPAGRFFVDFANPKARIAIECDGAEFHKDKEKDARRDKELRAAGWIVYRISGKDCRDGVNLEIESRSKAYRFISEIAKGHNLLRTPWRHNNKEQKP